MATVIHAVRQHHPVRTALLVPLFWVAAAALVVWAHLEVEPRSLPGGAAATIAAIIAAAFAYHRLAAREAGITHLLGVGIAWLVLAIVAEMAIARHLGHSWFSLLGSPDRPLLRNLYMFIWIFAPAFFSHAEGTIG